MPNILLTRIDNRLIHGQVGMTWTNSIGANLVLVANDQVAEDTVQQNLMDMAVPPTVDTRYFTLQKTIDIIGRAAEDQLIFIVVKTPQDALTLVEGSVPIKKINIGNLHYSEGKTQITNTVSIDDEDRKSFKKLMEHGVQLEIRGVPTESATDINKYL